MAGLGGGVIIKPLLDLIGDYDVATIGVLSAATVFSMACISLISSRRTDIKLEVKSSFLLAIGSVFGGLAGKTFFNFIVSKMNTSDVVTMIQAFCLTGLMIVIYIFVKHRGKFRTYQMTHPLSIVGIGVVLGMVSAFLGIGGGPLNVAILAICFSMGVRESALNSIFIIFFSQLSALVLVAFTTGFAAFDLSMLGYMIVGGMVGGFVGSRISTHLSNRFIEKVFIFGIIGIIGVNVFNAVRYFI